MTAIALGPLLMTTIIQTPVQGEMVGAYPFKSNKAACKHTAEQGRCLAHMFVMHVIEELPTWPEGAERKRVWVSAGILHVSSVNVQVSLEVLAFVIGLIFQRLKVSAVYAVFSRKGRGVMQT